VEIIKILLDKGMSVDLTNADDYTPLHFSASKGYLEEMRGLVETGAPLSNAKKNVEIPLL
jgi:ankyrin repeat protein